MRVILAVDSIHRPLTGIGRYAWQLCQGLKESPEISSLEYVSHGRWVEDPAGLLEPGPVSTAQSARKLLAGSRIATTAYTMLMPALMRWQLRQRRECLFHSPNFFLPPFPGAAISTFHDLSIYDHPEFHPQARVSFMRREIPKALRRARMLIAVSEFTRRQIIERFDWPEERIVTVLQGVDSDFGLEESVNHASILENLGLQPKGYTLCVSTIEPRKNLDRLINAYRVLPPSLRNDFPLVLVGEQGWRSEHTHLLIKQGVKDGWLHYHGYLPETQLRLVMRNCALFTFASVYEGFGLPVLEAMKSGRPVLSADLPPVKEFARDTIRYFDPYNIEEITAALQAGLEDQSWRESSGQLARKQADNFTWKETVKQTISAYRAAHC